MQANYVGHAGQQGSSYVRKMTDKNLSFNIYDNTTDVVVVLLSV